MEREKHHKFEEKVLQDKPEILIPNQVIRVERTTWKKRHLLATVILGAGVIFLAKKLRNKS